MRRRSKGIARIIRALIAQRDASVKALEEVVPHVRRKLIAWESGRCEPSLSTFIDLMTLLRCEVLLVPLGEGAKWVVLNKLPYDDGGELAYPAEVVPRGPLGRRQRDG